MKQRTIWRHGIARPAGDPVINDVRFQRNESSHVSLDKVVIESQRYEGSTTLMRDRCT
jgi:hypothetical protein